MSHGILRRRSQVHQGIHDTEHAGSGDSITPHYAAGSDATPPKRPPAASARKRGPSKPSDIDVSALHICDLRGLDFTRTRIKGTANYVTDAQRGEFGGTEYLLVREPQNQHDSSAVAVYGRGRKLGFISASKAASFAPLLDNHRADVFLIGGTTVIENSIRLWIDLPNVTALRSFMKDPS